MKELPAIMIAALKRAQKRALDRRDAYAARLLGEAIDDVRKAVLESWKRKRRY
jgi:GH15 family glucan-1,4-alpha-glucosidase